MRKGIAALQSLGEMLGVSVKAGHVKQSETNSRERARKRSKRQQQKASRRANR
jgi:hypothetical protein